MADLIHNEDEAGANTAICENQSPTEELEQETAVLKNVTNVPCRDWQIGCNLNECLLNVYNNDRWTDMTIRCGDNADSRTLKAHKIILAARSPVFEAMLFGPCSDGKTEYDFLDADVDIFDMMLRFMYNDDVNLTSVDDATDLMQMSHLYQIAYLVDHCILYIQNNITVDNVCKILDCAIKYCKQTLVDACCHFADLKAAEVIQTDGFLNVSKEGLIYMLKGDTFFADEDVIYYRVEEWAKRKLAVLGKEDNGQNVRNVLGDAFYYLRLPTLPASKLMECIEGKGYFSVDEYEAIMSCCLKRQPKLSFVSNVKHVPLVELFKTFTLSNADDSSNKKVLKRIDQVLQIKLEKDLHLMFIEIPFIQTYLKFPVNDKGRLSKLRAEGGIIPNCLNPLLSVVVTIDKINFENRFKVHHLLNTSFKKVFDKPIQLKKRESPYELRIQIESDSQNSDVWLEDIVGTLKAFSSSKVVSFSQTHQSANGIRAIGFRHRSFRGTVENSEQKKRKWENAFSD